MEITGNDVDALSRKFWTIPIIGLFYGLVAATLFYILGNVFNGLICSAIVLLTIHGLNRFLHFDGLIDLGDGLIATGTHDEKLMAMKDTRVGAGGVAFGLLFTLLILFSLSSVPHVIFIVPIAMEVLAKNSLFTTAAFGKPREGLGNPFVSNARRSNVVYSSMISLVLLLIFSSISYLSGAHSHTLAIMIVMMLAASIFTGYLMSKIAMRSFRSVNGDLLGATNEISKAAVLITALAVMAWMP